MFVLVFCFLVSGHFTFAAFNFEPLDKLSADDVRIQELIEAQTSTNQMVIITEKSPRKANTPIPLMHVHPRDFTPQYMAGNLQSQVDGNSQTVFIIDAPNSNVVDILEIIRNKDKNSKIIMYGISLRKEHYQEFKVIDYDAMHETEEDICLE